MQAARAVGSSDGGVISIRPRRGGPLAVVGHLSMYIQTETMSQSLIPTRGAACRREPLERARSNRRSHGGPAPAVGTLEGYHKREDPRSVPGAPGAVAWRTEVLQAEFRVRKACRKKERPPVPFGYISEGDRRTGFLGRPGFRTRISPARTTRAAWLIQRVHENHAARVMGSSDGGAISVQGIFVRAGCATRPLQNLCRPLFLLPTPYCLLPCKAGGETPP